MARIYGDCPACKASSADHDAWEFASARPADPDSQSDRLEAAIARRDWLTASMIQEFRGAEDATVYLFLRCPQNRGIVLLRLESFAELWADDRVTGRWVLNGEEVEAVNRLAGGAWRRVGEHERRPDV